VTEPAAPSQRHIAPILAKDLAANLATPMLLVDAEGDLVVFHELAEAILGRPYAEAGSTARRRAGSTSCSAICISIIWRVSVSSRRRGTPTVSRPCRSISRR
jgi:hypothetical protein